MTNFTTDELKSMTPLAYAKVRNAEVNAQAKDEGWTFWTNVPEDPEWFAEMGYETAYDYCLSSARQVMSDVFKENTGVRPRGIYPLDMTLEEVEAEIARLSETEEELIARLERESEDLKAQIRGGDGSLTYSPFAALLG